MKLDDIINKNYASIEQKIVLPPKNQTTQGIKIIVEAYKKLEEYKTSDFENKIDLHQRYTYLRKKIINKMDIKNIFPDEITQFSSLLTEFKDRPFFLITGLFLSALINYHHEKTRYEGTYTLLMNDLPVELDFVGFYNKSNLHIIGNLGKYTCHTMSKGTVFIEGNTSLFLGTAMSGGIISLHGETGEILCPNMMGGKVTIHKTAKKGIGYQMEGGTIELLGTYQEISPSCEYGTIIHQGKIIFHKEKHWYRKMIEWCI